MVPRVPWVLPSLLIIGPFPVLFMLEPNCLPDAKCTAFSYFREHTLIPWNAFRTGQEWQHHRTSTVLGHHPLILEIGTMANSVQSRGIQLSNPDHWTGWQRLDGLGTVLTDLRRLLRWAWLESKKDHGLHIWCGHLWGRQEMDCAVIVQRPMEHHLTNGKARLGWCQHPVFKCLSAVHQTFCFFLLI